MDDIVAAIKSKLNGKESARVKKINIVIGALDHINPDHFEFHFRTRVKGTFLEEAELIFRKDEANPVMRTYVESVELW